MVHMAAARGRGQHAHGDADGNAEGKTAGREQQRARRPLQDKVQYRLLLLEGKAEITMQQIDKVLDQSLPQRVIEVIMPLYRRAEFGRDRILPDHRLHRIARRQLQHAEHQQHHGDHERDRLQDPDNSEPNHAGVQARRKKRAAFL
jgi:hypothetical protein